ncbi:MAG TPA: M20/M25/M40 family metallo-hydrolase [Candidatus Thermoplasmatota archaeon]|nr:M20/M25/M40 family metallo-hydrolase [Candidatus Thermoplasmatota archaeon]
MKKSSDNILQTAIVFFIGISLSTSAASISISPQKDTITSGFDTQNMSTTGSQKIIDILSMINETLIRGYLQNIVGFGPRMTGSYGCEKAAQYIHKQFTQMQLITRYQNWTAWGNRFYRHLYTSQNVEGTLLGTNPIETSSIIFNAHYDSVAKGPGANDDGSGTVAVLAAAYALSHFDFERTVKFMTFSGEEIGLLGSRAYTKEAYERDDNILVEINADMIGHDEGSRKMTVTATEDAGWVADIFQTINNNYTIGLAVNRGTINRIQHKISGSDYAVFLPYGWESICCWERDRDPNFHTAADNLSNVNISYLVNTTRIIAATLAYLADITETPPQVRITSPRVGFLYNAGMKKRAIDEFKTTVINDIWVWAEVDYATVPIERAEFYYDGKLVFTDTEAPFKWQFNKFSLRKHQITVVVYDQLGRNSSDWREIRFINIFKRIK